ncbi:MAG: PorP/SprF family type IX secretion system membrane protein, partial [Chitinophagaceae bacterium]
MRLLTCLCIALLTAISVKAQQKPHYTQYMLNNYIINPAITGIENYTDVKVSHRHQWVGLQDAPVTTYLTVHTPLGKKDDRATMNSYDVTSNINPMGKRYWDDYTASEPHHGIGLQIVNDRIGPFNTFSAMATYAYHLGLSAKTNISAGVGVGFNNISINQQKTFFGADFPIDPALSNSREFGRYRLDVSAGVYLYSSD